MKKVNSIAILWEQIEWGGVDSYLSYFLNNKKIENIKVTIFTNKNNKGLPRFIKFNKNLSLKVIKYKSLLTLEFKNFFLKKIYYFLKPVFFILTYFQLKFLLRKDQFDVFLGMCGGYGQIRSEMAGVLSASSLKIPVISLVIHHACIKPPPFMSLFISIVNKLISKIVSSVITVSEATKKTLFYKSNLLDEDNVNTLVIHHGISSRDYEKNIKHVDNKKEFIEAGIISRIEDYKGHYDLIYALKELPIEYLKKIRINIIGSGGHKETQKLTLLINQYKLNNVVFLKGYIDQPVVEILSELDLLLSLTRSFEGFGLSMLEAATYGIPIIATEVGAVNEFLDKNYSLIIKPSSPEIIKNKLIEFIDNRKKWNDLANKYRHILLTKFNEDKMVKKYLDHFNQTLNLQS